MFFDPVLLIYVLSVYMYVVITLLVYLTSYEILLPTPWSEPIHWPISYSDTSGNTVSMAGLIIKTYMGTPDQPTYDGGT